MNTPYSVVKDILAENYVLPEQYYVLEPAVAGWHLIQKRTDQNPNNKRWVEHRNLLEKTKQFLVLPR